jgi:hypothetical protein
MKEQILSYINDPRRLEKLYRSNRTPFRREFGLLYPQLRGNVIADFWHERLNYENDDLSWGSSKDIAFVIFASITAGLLAKLPAIFNLNDEHFYQRNIGFIVIPILTFYFAWKNELPTRSVVLIGITFLAALGYMNFLPQLPNSDSIILSSIHMPLFLWCVLGFAFAGGRVQNHERRLGFLQFNGDLAVITAMIAIAGAILTGVTIGLFAVIGMNIEKFYTENVVIFSMAAAPVVGTYLIQTNPQIVNKVSPLIAKIFSPLVLVTLLVYLTAMLISGKNLFQDREFLITFNALLIGVMAIIFFSVAGTGGTKNYSETLVLFLLSVVTLIVNGIALSAIGFRISEWGITPNRIAVLGANILMLTNLILVTIKLLEALRDKNDNSQAGAAIALFLPVYAVWTFVVAFLFPVLFGFR